MSAKLYYGGHEFPLASGTEDLDPEVLWSRIFHANEQGGGSVTVETTSGTLRIVVGPNIPVAILDRAAPAEPAVRRLR